MALMMRGGDYVFDGVDGLRRAEGQEALLQRVLFRLSARRGAFPFMEELGSRLWQLGRLPASVRSAAAMQYVTEALAEEPDVSVESVLLEETGDGAVLRIGLDARGERTSVTMELRL
jgi:phage gp46-like protein